MTPGINKPGLAKLNTQSSTLGSASFKATTANKLASSTRSGQSYGIMAQRSAVGTGAIFNVKRYNSASISAQRHALNDNRTIIRNNNVIGTPIAPHNCSGNNAMNKYAAALAVTGMLTKTLGSIVSATKSSNTQQASSVAKNGTAGVLNELATAKNSADIQKGLAQVETEMKDYESQIADAEKTIKEETELKSQNETKLKDTETQIQSEKQNIAKQEGTITKLKSSIQTDKMTLSTLESQLSSAGELTKMSIQSQISELKTKIAQEEKQLKEAEASKADSQKKLEELGDTKKDLTNQIANNEKNIQNAEAEKNSASSKKDSLEQAKVKYTKKLSDVQNKESAKLAKLHTEIANYAKEFSETSDTKKKNKLSEKYAEKAKEYNELVRNSTVSGHTEVGLDLNSL